jgi:hypothetical protein
VRDGAVPVSHFAESLNRSYARCQDSQLGADPFYSPSGSATRSGGSEPRGEVTVASLASADQDAAEIIEFATRTANLVQLLQRRLRAAEKSNDAKALKIEQLLEENAQ